MTATASRAEASPATPDKPGSVRVWDLPLRLFHWLLVLAILVAFLSSEEDSPLNQWHVLAGWVAGILIVFRLVWGFVGGEHSRFANFVRPSRIGAHIAGIFRKQEKPTLGHNPLGGISVLTLLTLIAATVWTGAFGGERAEDIHELVAWTLLAFVGLHIAAVAIMSVLQRENLIRAMITGRKRAVHYPDAPDARRPSPGGIALAILVLIGTVYGVLQYDPHAFTLRSAESFEQSRAIAGQSLKAPERDED